MDTSANTIPIANSWPAGLPIAFIDYSGSSRNATVVAPLEQAIPKRRSRSKTTYANVRLGWRLSEDEYVGFQNFFANDLGNGSSWFAIDLRYPKNTELKEWTVRFIGGYTATNDEGIWSISADVEIGNPVQVSALSVGFDWVAYYVEPENSDDPPDQPLMTIDGFIYAVKT